ncbi:MAG: hypothetical protein DMG40_21390 [Acidobacteria bacterium]|nr:MAG: hypothetical protein DMG40_21390 [Acidobacteriota bacterium]
MRDRTANLASALVVMIVLLLAPCLRAQESEATLSGKVTDASGAIVANAKVSVKNPTTGQTMDVQTDATGTYNLTKLAPGEYEVTASAEGFAAKIEKVTLAAGASLTFNATLSGLPSAPPPQPQAPANNPPNAPSSIKEPSLADLGFASAETKSHLKEQALLDKRTHMLRIHQRLGLITTIPMIASVATSINAGGRHTSNTDRTVHMVLGSATADLYFMTAYFAIRAPRVEGTKSRGPIRFHKAMAWIHGPGMILTPILGAIAYSQKNNGQRVQGMAKAHGPVAIVTAGAFGAALLSVSLRF